MVSKNYTIKGDNHHETAQEDHRPAGSDHAGADGGGCRLSAHSGQPSSV